LGEVVRSSRAQAGRVRRLMALLVVVSLVAGCAASRAFSRAEQAAMVDNWEEAVEYYRIAARERPDRPEYRIALERAQQQASVWHFSRARQLEAEDRLDEALREYRRALDFDPSNRQSAFRASEVERTIRDRIEAARPRPAIDVMREQARRDAQEPVLNPASREPLSLRFTNASLRDILTFIGNSTGINVTYDRDFQDRSVTIQLDGVTLEQALQQLMIANQFFYKVLSERSIIVAADTVQKRQQYEEQVIRTFYVSHSDATELAQLIAQVIRVPAMAIQPMIVANKTSNTVTVRASTSVAGIIERMIEANDKPRAEVVVDVSILEVSRERAKDLGLDLSSYSISGFFSPEVAPGEDGAVPPFNVNTISRGVSTADFYMAVPSAIVRFLETDSETKVVAKPQLRGSEGQKVTLNLGEEVPVPSTTFTPFAGGGANINPLTSFAYRPIGVIVEMTPRVTYDGEIIMDLVVESSARGRDSNIAGQNLPSFGSRKVSTRLRLRDGESNLLAGLLREDERRVLRGFAGVLRLPILRELFSSSDSTIQQTDIVMLLTPRVIRTHELTQTDLSPIYIGTQGNLGLGGPPPLFGVPDPPPPDAAAATGPTAVTPQVPPGSSPIPGTTMAPAPPEEAAPPAVTAFPPLPEPAVETPAPAEAPPAPAGPLAAHVLVTPPATDLTVGGGPYTVPVSITGASRLSTVTVSLTFNPSVLRVRSVQEGTFMRQGGATAVFSQQVDAASGRIDLVISRAGDETGAVGSGLLAAILFEPVAAGSSPLSASGVGTAPDGASLPLQFTPVTVSVR
jgi:general secretion pathway protein D